MTEDDGERAVRNLARMLVKELLADDAFKSMVREIVLTTYLTTDRMSRDGYVRTLVRACKERGVTLEVNKAGGLIAKQLGGKRKLTPDLEQAVRTYRVDIIECLRPSTNGHHKGK